MKKIIFLLLVVIVFIPIQGAYGQFAVIDAALDALLTVSHIDQIIYYGQQVAHNASEAAKTVQMVESYMEQVKRTAQNLGSAKDIRSFDDFMDWYNRQLYLEKQSVDAFRKMNVTIGKKNYSLMDIAGMADGFKDTYVDYWNKEFTEDQRREMWLGLGLTPANYAYVMPFREKRKQLLAQEITMSDIINESYMVNTLRRNEIQKKLTDEKNKKLDDKMGTNEILEHILETNIQNGKSIDDMSMSIAKQMELNATEKYLNRAPDRQPALTDFPDDVFGKPASKEKAKK